MTLQHLLNRLDEARPLGCSRAGWLSLQFGVLFLPTSAFLSGLFLLVAITIGRPKSLYKPFQRPISRVLLMLSGLMVVGLGTALRPDLAAVGLANWLPFFWFFLAVAPYVSTSDSRTRVASWILIGTVPISVIGLIQAWLGWSTPLQYLGGLIEWTMRYPERATGIFDTVNGTAGWLLISFPFLLQRLRHQRRSAIANKVTIVIIALSTTSLLLTSSRTAVIMLPVVVLLSARKRQLPWVLIPIALYGLLVGFKLTGWIDHWPGINPLVPDLLVEKLKRLIDPAAADLASPEVRASLYPVGLQLIQTSPWLGIGENGFRTLLLAGAVSLPTTESLNHTHSLPLEFALSHGLPAMALLVSAIGWVYAKAVQRWRQQPDPNGQDRAWLLAAGMVVWMHIWDIPAYDSRFNMAGWLIFASLLAIGSNPRQPLQMSEQQTSQV